VFAGTSVDHETTALEFVMPQDATEPKEGAVSVAAVVKVWFDEVDCAPDPAEETTEKS
jgi:hypothetical protein